MLKNFKKLNERLSDCEEYIQNVVDGKQSADPQIARNLNSCMSQFSEEDMVILE